MKRLFLAFEAPETIKDTAKKYRESSLDSKNVKWNNSHDLHITVLPPWHTKKPLENVQDNLKLDSIKECDLWVHFFKIEPGPRSDDPRLIWAVGQPSLDLTALRNSLYAFHPKINSPKFSDYIPHVTLGRGHNLNNFSIVNIDITNELSELKLYETVPVEERKNGNMYKIHDIMKRHD